jgi:hypothetical protein
MDLRSAIELSAGTSLFLFSLVACIMFVNKITYLANPSGSRNINIFFLCLHLIMVVAFVVALRKFFFKYIQNKDVLNSIFTLTGPIIGLSSLYMSDSLRSIVGA